MRLNNYRGHKLVTGPSVEPVTATELRTHLRETEAGLSDGEAAIMIGAARRAIEDATGIACITQTWTLSIDAWPYSRSDALWDGFRQAPISFVGIPEHTASVQLPRYPLQSVTTVATYAADGTETTHTVGTYFDVDVYELPGRIRPKSGQTWPYAGRDIDAIRITYVAGYGDGAADLPESLKHAVMMGAAYLYANRGDGCCDMRSIVSASGAAGLANLSRVVRI